MTEKPTHEELVKRVRRLEREAFQYRQAQKALKQSEMKYRLIAESATDVICVIRLDRFVLSYASPSVETVFGYAFEELMSLNIYDFLTPDSADRVMAVLGQEMEKNKLGKAKPQRLEIEILCKDGSTVWTEVSARFLRDDNDRITDILCVLRDVSERKKLEKELLENKKKFQSLYDNAPDMYFTVSPDGIITSVNQFGADYLGFSVDELAGNFVWKIVYEDDLEKVQHHIKQIFNKKLPKSELEFRKKRKDGSILWVQERTQLILDVNDAPVELRIICRDVSTQKTAEIALRESEERYRDIIDKSDDIIWMLDLYLRTIYVSPSIEKKLGFTPKERMAQAFSSQVTPESYGNIMALLAKELDKENQADVDPNRTVRVEVEYYRKNGSTMWAENIVSGIRDENGSLLGIHGVSRDITIRKKIEMEKEQLKAQLVYAQKMESIGTLVGGIAHDFNNILGVIIGNIELAMDDIPDGHPAHYCLDQIKQAGDRATGIVRQLLTFACSASVKRQPLALTPVLREAINFLRSTIPTTIDIQTDFKAARDTVSADSMQMHQVLINLCSNAAQAMKQKVGTIAIGVENETLSGEDEPRSGLPAGEYVKLTVADTGPGIDEDIISRIFDPYFTTKEVGEGSGMGLSVVLGIVKSCDGSISVDSQQGEGTAFNILFPLVSEAPKQKVEITEDIPTGHERILLVDDDAALLKVGRDVLEHLGYTVEPVLSPTEALQKFSARPDHFDLIVTDMTMPKMTGVTLSKRAKEIRKNIPVILCTGHSDLVYEENAEETGVNAYLMKPIHIKDIAKTVRVVLDRK